MADVRARIDQPNEIKVRVGQQNAVKVVSSLAGTVAGVFVSELDQLNDVDADNLLNGMVLVYNSTTQKWEATLSLTPGITQNLDIDGGTF